MTADNVDCCIYEATTIKIVMTSYLKHKKIGNNEPEMANTFNKCH